jgi:hypothetical protein
MLYLTCLAQACRPRLGLNGSGFMKLNYVMIVSETRTLKEFGKIARRKPA